MSIAESIGRVRERLETACRRSGRPNSEVALMAVSKFHGPRAVEEAYRAGIRLFGESRVQEARDKFSSLTGMEHAELHLIGTLQRNKAKSAVELFSCVQSVDRIEIITELAKRAQANGVRLNILLELHTGEESKAGFLDFDSLCVGVETALGYPTIAIRGLMTMAPYTTDERAIRASFRALRSARDRLAARFPDADWSTLSMGMTNDFEIAVEEGSTLVRVGTAIFGHRADPGDPR